MTIQTIKRSSRTRARAAAKPKRSGVVPKMPMQRLQHGGAAMAVFTGPGMPSAANTTVSFGGDPILMHAEVALIFYGSAWQNPGVNPSAGAIQNAIQTVLASPYCSQLIDYECTGGGMSNSWNLIVTDDPPNPFSQDDAEDIAEDMIDQVYSNLPPNARPTFYAVFVPPGVPLDTPGINGAHSNDGGTYYSWQLFGTLDFITQVFTHELVEAITDSDGGGWQVDPRSGSNWNEIADICKNTSARVNGVAVAAYYSTSVGACVVPQPDPPPPPPPVLPNGKYQITCGIFAWYKYSRYLWVIGGSVNGKPWLMMVDHAVQRVQNGQLKFYTLADGQKASVTVGLSPTNHLFLTTSPDTTKANNLDVIAEVSPCQEPDDGIFWQ